MNRNIPIICTQLKMSLMKLTEQVVQYSQIKSSDTTNLTNFTKVVCVISTPFTKNTSPKHVIELVDTFLSDKDSISICTSLKKVSGFDYVEYLEGELSQRIIDMNKGNNGGKDVA